VVQTREDLSNGGGVGDHAHCTLDLGQISSWHNGWWLVVDTALETGWAPVDELDGALGFNGGNSSVDVLGDDITSVHQAAGHVLSVTGVALGHHGGWLKGRVGDLSDGELLVVGLLGRDDWSIGRKHEVNAWVWDQVGLELGDIDVESAIKTKRGGQRGDDLGNQTIEVGVGWSLNVQGATADVVDGLIIKHDRDISVLQEGVGGEDRVVRLNNSGGDLWGWVDSETKLGFLAIVN